MVLTCCHRPHWCCYRTIILLKRREIIRYRGIRNFEPNREHLRGLALISEKMRQVDHKIKDVICIGRWRMILSYSDQIISRTASQHVPVCFHKVIKEGRISGNKCVLLSEH